MTYNMKKLANTINASLIALLAIALPLAVQAEAPQEGNKIRSVAMTVEAKVTAIDPQSRELSLTGPAGETVTLRVRESVGPLDDIKVGDSIVASYMAAMEAELRAPTEEELAEPWVVVSEEAESEDPEHPGIGGARVIRAVCTLEGMNRELGTATLKDPRGKLHLITDVEPEKMDGVTLGETVVVVFAEALALTLERKPAAAE